MAAAADAQREKARADLTRDLTNLFSNLAGGKGVGPYYIIDDNMKKYI